MNTKPKKGQLEPKIKIGNLTSKQIKFVDSGLYDTTKKHLQDIDPEIIATFEGFDIKKVDPTYEEEEILTGIIIFIIFQFHSKRNLNFYAFVGDYSLCPDCLYYVLSDDWQEENGLTDEEVEWMRAHHPFPDENGVDIILNDPTLIDNNFDNWIEDLRKEQKTNSKWNVGL